MIIDKRYPIAEVQENLRGILTKYLQALQTDSDFPKMEENFFMKTRNTLNILKKNNFKVILAKNPSEIENAQIIEITHYMGFNYFVFLYLYI